MGVELVEDVVFPEDAHVVATKRRPAAVIAHEPGVEAVDLRRGDDLRRPVGGVRPNDVDDEGGLEGRDVVGDRGPADFGCSCQGGRLEQAATLYTISNSTRRWNAWRRSRRKSSRMSFAQ